MYLMNASIAFGLQFVASVPLALQGFGEGVVGSMMFLALLAYLIPIAAAVFLLWLALRFVRAVERIADKVGG